MKIKKIIKTLFIVFVVIGITSIVFLLIRNKIIENKIIRFCNGENVDHISEVSYELRNYNPDENHKDRIDITDIIESYFGQLKEVMEFKISGKLLEDENRVGKNDRQWIYDFYEGGPFNFLSSEDFRIYIVDYITDKDIEDYKNGIYFVGIENDLKKYFEKDVETERWFLITSKKYLEIELPYEAYIKHIPPYITESYDVKKVNNCKIQGFFIKDSIINCEIEVEDADGTIRKVNNQFMYDSENEGLILALENIYYYSKGVPKREIYLGSYDKNKYAKYRARILPPAEDIGRGGPTSQRLDLLTPEEQEEYFRLSKAKKYKE